MKCPVCNSESAYKFKSILKKNIYQCTNNKCRHLFVEHFSRASGLCDRGEDLAMDKLKNDRQRRIKIYGERNKELFRAIWKKLNLKEDASVLDFGSGDGNLMFSLKELYPQVKIVCIEPHDVFQVLLNDVADYTVESPFELKEQFDLIMLNEVIEHLNYPVKVLTALVDVLKNEHSAMYIATPLGETHTLANDTHAYDTDSHLHFFTRNSLNVCLYRRGLSSLDYDDINQPLYNNLIETGIKGKTKFYLRQTLLKRLTKLSKRYCMLPAVHISGLAYKQL